MNDQPSFERLFADRMEAERGSTKLPDAFYNEFRHAASHTRQRPRWLAMIKEPPMRISSSLAVGSPTARVVAIMVATLLLAIMVAGAGIAGSRLLAADSAIIVDQSGAGDYTTITEAVTAAVDGDEVVVMPGVYTEYVDIDKHITLRGDGAPEDVVIEFSDEGQTAPIAEWGADFPFGIAIRAANVSLRDLTVRSAPPRVDNGIAINVQGGSPTIQRVVAGPGEDAAIVLSSATQAHVSEVRSDGKVLIEEGSMPTIEDSLLCGGMFILSDAIVRDNRVIQATPDGEECVQFGDGPSGETIAIEGSSPTLTGNTILGLVTGIDVYGATAAPLIEANVLRDMPTAISSGEGTSPTIRSNEFVDNRVAISLPGGTGGSDTLVEDNVITGGQNAILVTGGTSTIKGNTIKGATGRAIAIGPNAGPTLRDNVLCGNDENLFIADGATPDIDDSNEVCPDGLSE